MKQFLSLTTTILLTLLVGISCNSTDNRSSNSQSEGNEINLSLYETRAVPGSDWLHVERYHPNGDVYEEGYIKDNKKTGTWTTYFPDDGYLERVSNFNNGVLMGPFMEFDERGRLEKHSNYENNNLTGLYAEFKNGRLIKKIQYKEGKFNGFVREYNSKSKIIKEAYYKDNVLDGEVRHWNDDEKLVLRYLYKDGAKVSGGIVE